MGIIYSMTHRKANIYFHPLTGGTSIGRKILQILELRRWVGYSAIQHLFSFAIMHCQSYRLLFCFITAMQRRKQRLQRYYCRVVYNKIN